MLASSLFFAVYTLTMVVVSSSQRDCVMDAFQLNQFVTSATSLTRTLPAFTSLARRCSPLLDRSGAMFVPHGTTCNASETCETKEMMATQWVCDDGAFIWDELYVEDKATWCPLWRHCDFDSANFSLTCEANKRAEGNRADRLPLNLDPRLRSLTVVGEAAQLLPEQAMVRLEVLEHLNLSHNQLSDVDPFSLNVLPRLTSLDLSSNRLMSPLLYAQLPAKAQLRYLSLASQAAGALTVVAPAIVAAMDTCLADGPPTLLIDSANCSVVPRAELRNFDGTASTCDRIICNSDSDDADDAVLRVMPCPGDDASAGKSTPPMVRSTYLCDGIVDCPMGGDEDPSYCNFALDFVSHLTADELECIFTSPCFLSKINVRVRHGVVSLEQPFSLVSADCVARFSAGFLGGAYLYVTPTRLEFSISGEYLKSSYVLSRLPLNGTRQPYLLNATVQRLTPGDADIPSCTFVYVERTDTAVAPPPFKNRGHDGSNISNAAWAALAAVACIMIIVWGKRRANANERTLDRLAPSTPPSLIQQAQEQFLVQYAGVVEDSTWRQSLEDAYSRRLVAMSDIQITDHCLGEGVSGKVFLATLRTTKHWQSMKWSTNKRGSEKSKHAAGVQVAVKIVERAAGGSHAERGSKDAVVQCALLEARLHARLDHPNLVRLLAVQEERQPVMLALELCEHGALLQVLRARASTGYDFDGAQRRDMATQVAAGLRYLHSKLCIHRDVAARNVLVAGTAQGGTTPPCGYVLKLSDLGLARQLRTEADYYRTRGDDDAVPIRWQCPEAVLTRVYTAKSDVYSFGVLLYEMYSGGGTPFSNLAASEVLVMVKAGERLARPSADMTEDMLALMRTCTDLRAGQRPSMAAVHARLLGGAWRDSTDTPDAATVLNNLRDRSVSEADDTETSL